MTRKYVKTIDLTDYSSKDHDEPDTVVRLISDPDFPPMDGMWEAHTYVDEAVSSRGLVNLCAYGSTPEKAVRNLHGGLKALGGSLFKKANYLLNMKIPDILDEEKDSDGG